MSKRLYVAGSFVFALLAYPLMRPSASSASRSHTVVAECRAVRRVSAFASSRSEL